MAKKNDDLLDRLRATFRVEADEHLGAMSAGLLALGTVPAGAQRAGIVEQVFRAAHSLKGAARAVNFTSIEAFCQSLENVFAALKSDRLAPSPPVRDLLQQAVDALGGVLAADAGTTLPAAVAALLRHLDDTARGVPPAAAAASYIPTATPPAASAGPSAGAAHAPIPAAVPTAGTVRVSTERLDAVMRQAEELLAPRLAAAERCRELGEATTALAAWKRERAHVQPALRRMERTLEGAAGTDGSRHNRQALARLLDYLETEQTHLKLLGERLGKLKQAAEHDRRLLAGLTDDLLQNVKEMQLLPFASLLELLPRAARALAREQGKQVELAIQSADIEIDRRILEAMKDPLMHLLRNGIDHGIEQADARIRLHKPPHGLIRLTLSQQDSGKVEIVLADDGAGIDTGRVKAAALKAGLLTAEEAERLGEPEALALVLRSGVTTSPIVTDVSGRGLGLAIVRENVERLGGTLAIESQPAVGTTFRLVLPLTLATFRGVLVRAGGRPFVIPTIAVERVLRVAEADIRTVENRETICPDGRTIALAWLSDTLELPRPDAAGGGPAVVLGADPARIAFRVDDVLGEQEVLVKPLGRQLTRVRNVAGASVLGTGQVVPVLNVADLLKSAVRPAAPARLAAGSPRQDRQPSILVVEDSITSRVLLKNILESAGYQVTTAVDGIDAYAALKTGAFDLLVSDVEMPRMDGFELVARVRADRQLAELPAVLVTALESREHREHGAQVGANAYIAKNRFDQSNLLEVVRRLL